MGSSSLLSALSPLQKLKCPFGCSVLASPMYTPLCPTKPHFSFFFEFFSFCMNIYIYIYIYIYTLFHLCPHLPTPPPGLAVIALLRPWWLGRQWTMFSGFTLMNHVPNPYTLKQKLQSTTFTKYEHIINSLGTEYSRIHILNATNDMGFISVERETSTKYPNV